MPTDQTTHRPIRIIRPDGSEVTYPMLLLVGSWAGWWAFGYIGGLLHVFG